MLIGSVIMALFSIPQLLCDPIPFTPTSCPSTLSWDVPGHPSLGPNSLLECLIVFNAPFTLVKVASPTPPCGFPESTSPSPIPYKGM